MPRVCCVLGFAVLAVSSCTSRSTPSLAGDWDAYVALGSTPLPGFEGWRRMGFAHFASDSGGITGSIRRRTGEAMLDLARAEVRSDSIFINGARNQTLAAVWHGDTLTGLMLAAGKPTGRRMRLVRRAMPFSVEQQFPLWPGAVSDSQYAVTEDTLVFMKTHDGAKLANYIARPVGKGPFGVVLQRTPYTRILHPAGRFWASHGYVSSLSRRGRDTTDGKISATTTPTGATGSTRSVGRGV